ncbi:MAG: hypothetical protein QW445_03415 [Candidatus Bathyarchaeia archaeon]
MMSALSATVHAQSNYVDVRVTAVRDGVPVPGVYAVYMAKTQFGFWQSEGDFVAGGILGETPAVLNAGKYIVKVLVGGEVYGATVTVTDTTTDIVIPISTVSLLESYWLPIVLGGGCVAVVFLLLMKKRW